LAWIGSIPSCFKSLDSLNIWTGLLNKCPLLGSTETSPCQRLIHGLRLRSALWTYPLRLSNVIELSKLLISEIIQMLIYRVVQKSLRYTPISACWQDSGFHSWYEKLGLVPS
jgi:hypothetical protein